jgi:hypothetical protein
MNPLNLNELYGKRYRIKHDPAAELEPGGKRDPWLFIIPCKYGHIYPHSDRLLAVWVEGAKIRRSIKAKFPGLECRNWSDNGEAVFLFPPDVFDRIAGIVRPWKRRGRKQLSPDERARLVESGTEYRFRKDSAGKTAVQRPLERRSRVN